MDSTRISILWCALAVGSAVVAPDARAMQSCESLATLQFPNATVTVAELITSGTFDPPGSAGPITGVPPFCRVSLTVLPHIRVETWLPVDWNQRLQSIGGGGYAGDLSWGLLAEAISDGYAATLTDTGHDDAVTPGGSFALRPDGTLNWPAIIDYASRSVHEMTVKTQALIEAFYGRPAAFSYWNGCSTGGRQGLMEAQRFPQDYDGILAGAPANNWDPFLPAELWAQVVMHQELGGPIAGSKLTAVTRDAIAACDALDGVEDGVIDDPRRCHYDPAASICKADDDPARCLTAGEAAAVRKIWDGPTTARGGRLWFGLERGAVLGGVAGTDPFSIPVDYFRYWLHQDPSFDWHTLDEASFPDETRRSELKFHDVIGTDDPNLAAFHRAGGKLILWHGLADQLIFPRGTIRYYESVRAANGGAGQVEDFARLFLAPGVDHCGFGYGPSSFDMFKTLIDWVESGVVPDRIIAAKLSGNKVVATRPLCPYPQAAQWTGQGSPADASNFVCADVPHDSADLAIEAPRGTVRLQRRRSSQR